MSYLAYKVWYDTRHFIANTSTDDTIDWTTDIDEAMECDSHQIHKVWGFSYNQSGYDALKFITLN